MREKRAAAHPHSGPLEDPAQAANVCAIQCRPHWDGPTPQPQLTGSEGEVPSLAYWGVFQYQQPVLSLSRHRPCVQQFSSILMLTTWRQICDQGLTPTRLQRPVSSPDSSGYPSTFVPLGCKFSHNLVPHPLARFGHKGLLINSKRDSYYSGNLKSISIP